MPVAGTGPRTPIFNYDNMIHRRVASRNIDDADSTRIWIIIASITGILALGAGIALVAMCLSRRRLKEQLLHEALQRDPFLYEKESSKKRRMAREILELEAESQRDAIIRKSLASRSGRSISSNSQLIGDTMSMDDRPDSRSTRKYRLRDEEDSERSFMRSRCGTGLSDKSWEDGISSRSRSPFPEVPERTWSRSSSPSRRADLPPLLEQHPLFRNASGGVNSEFERR